MKTLNISGKFEEIFDLRSKDNNAKVQITMTSWTKLEKFNLVHNLMILLKNICLTFKIQFYVVYAKMYL